MNGEVATGLPAAAAAPITATRTTPIRPADSGRPRSTQSSGNLATATSSGAVRPGDAGELGRLPEDVVDHRLGQPAGERVLLAGVVATDHRDRSSLRRDH